MASPQPITRAKVDKTVNELNEKAIVTNVIVYGSSQSLSQNRNCQYKLQKAHPYKVSKMNHIALSTEIRNMIEKVNHNINNKLLILKLR